MAPKRQKNNTNKEKTNKKCKKYIFFGFFCFLYCGFDNSVL